MASTFLTKTLGTSTNTYKGTVSVWLKRCGLSGDQVIYGNYTSGTQRGKLVMASDGKLMYYQNDSGVNTIKVETHRLFRDVGAWYHIVLSVDTTQSTAADRVKLYVNGVQESHFDTATYPSQNTVFYLNGNSVANYIGQEGNSSDYWDGLMSHFHVIDGTAYAASTFGETDSTTGEWTILTSPSVTYGNNGFFILRDGNSVTDVSGNSNNWTVGGGTLTNTEDCPDNNFCTINPLDNKYPNYTFANGNNTVTTGGNYSYCQATQYVATGKYYWEVKVVSKTGGGEEYMIGVQGKSVTATNSPAQSNGGYTIYANDGQVYGVGATASYGSAYTAGDIIGVALDCDNNKLYWSKNGSWMGSGNPSSGSNGYSINAASSAQQQAYSPVAGFYASNNAVFNFNFGNGFFGTTAISSEGSNASGIGKFEYDVPTGYTALSTKGLNE